MTLEMAALAWLYPTLLVFARVGSAAMLLPGIGEQFVPARTRLALALAISIALAPVLPDLPARPPEGPAQLAGAIGIEVFIGIFLGAIVRILFFALTVAGQIIGQSMALSNIFVLPGAGLDGSSVISTMLTLAGLAFFFVADLHHDAIEVLARSYFFLPVGVGVNTGSLSQLFARTVSDSFTLGVQLAAPFLVLGFVFYLGVGLINKMMVSLPVFFISMPIAILGGLAILAQMSGLILAVFGGSVEAWLDSLGR